MTVNLWTEPAWAKRYLGERDDIPHRREGLAVLLELVREMPRRVLDLGRARERFVGAPDVEIVEHDLDQSLPLERLGRFDLVVSSFAIHHVVDARKRALYSEVFDALEPGGMFANLEHVASATERLHREFLAAIGKDLSQDDPSNKLAPVEAQLSWMREIGFVDVDCFWKWRELALLAGVRPGS